MTTDLHDLMSERAERLDPPTLDASAIMAAGDRRVRRRRWTGGAGAAVLCVAAALAAPAVLGGSGTDGLVAERPADSEDPVAWVSGSVLHTSPDGPTVDLAELGREPISLVQADSGFVFSEADGSVHAVIDDEVVEVGTLQVPESPRFESDGDVVAWVDAGEGEPAYAALDLSKGAGVVSLPVRRGYGTPLERELGMTEAVAAVDGDTVYLRAPNGARVWRPFAADDQVVSLPVADGTRVVLEDVQNGVFHYHRAGGTPAAKEEAYVVGPDLSTGVEVESWEGILSPDGRYLVSEMNDENVVSDTATGARLPFDLGEYSFLAGYRWLDDDTYAALAMKDVSGDRVDLLRCEVTTGSCEPVVTGLDLLGDSRLVIPIGEGW
ncbi:hypothetical protein [Nocardioides campestrisoli]|uniref:hypothetical protein n=1 Tax=Nocardioides campestrisoli TaxID=2736757 RepID=UPI0015E68691|nr:hypothetical protein [Nocardioides campestrisoli]